MHKATQIAEIQECLRRLGVSQVIFNFDKFILAFQKFKFS